MKLKYGPLVSGILLAVVIAVPALAGEKYCWSQAGPGASLASCQNSPTATGSCTVVATYMVFNAGCSICTTSTVQCDVQSLSNDLRVDLATSGQNYVATAVNVGVGFTSPVGSGVVIDCYNFGADSVEVSMITNCH